MIRNVQRLWKGDGCLVYKRCSKDVQDASLDDQEQVLSLERAALGLSKVIATFEDDGLRGHDETRPGLLAVLEYVKTHPNPVRSNSDFIPILVYELSRFGRFDDSKKIFAYFVEIERYGYEFYSVTEKIRSRGNIADFVQAIIKSEQAYDYSVNLSKYGLRTGCSLAEKGWWPGGSAPYAFDRMTHDPDGRPKYRYTTRPDKTVEKRSPDGTLVETLRPIEDKGKRRSAYSDKLKGDRVKLVPGDPRFIAIVRLIFEKFVKEGWGLRRIASWLNMKGVPPPRGRKWLHTSVRGVIVNPAYKGALVYGRKSDGKHHWLTIQKTETGYAPIIERKDVPGKEYVCRPVGECILVEDCHEGIVDKAVWSEAQEKLDEDKLGSKKLEGSGTRSAYLLSGDGLMKCAHCGYRFQGDTDRRSRIRRYMDSGYHMGGKTVCRCYLVPADPLETWMIDQIKTRIFGPGALFGSRAELEKALEQALAAGQQAASNSDREIQDLERRIAEKKEKAKLLVANVSPENLAFLNEAVGELRKETEAMENELRAVRVATRAEGIITRNLKALARQAADYVVHLKDVLEAGTVDERKRFIRAFVHEIVVDGKKRRVQVTFYDDGLGAEAPSPLAAVEAVAGRLGDSVSPQLAPPRGSTPYGKDSRHVHWKEVPFPQPLRRKRGRPGKAEQ
jgi:DNA invertase Pin-like site-specific DNA recombinase